jgi:iron(III) transport system ATP-binding protein|tara:strand:- start:311 stop:1255 length:945 start_codon:yes stop_codon:yes gene_type:complete
MLQVTIKSFSYAEKEILTNIIFNLEKGKHLAILGESGCGKSTLLHLIYGLLNLDQGSIYWGSKKLMGPKANLVPGELFIKLVSQEFNLMPFISVAENIASHLSRMDQQLDDNRVDELLRVVDLKSFKGALVKNLSGGQKQRVVLAKALANKPELLLLDEPFSNIDARRKNKLRRDLYAYLRLNNISCITATHDSEEALGFSDEIIILQDGTTLAQGTPSALFQNISTEYEAGFFGDITVLPSHLFHSEASSKFEILLPHQLIITEKTTKLIVNVKTSYFRGKDYLIQADWNGRDVFFENLEKLEKGTLVNLQKK